MAKFELGRIVVTRGIDTKMKEDKHFGDFVKRSLERYANADWGDTCEEDCDMNNESLLHQERLLGVYIYNDQPIWIITEWDRSVTTVLFPSEY